MKPKYATTIALTEAENKIKTEIQAKGISVIDIFRKGLEIYQKEVKK